MIKNKLGLQVSFAWLFAIVVGGFILFLAIYGVVQFTDTGDEVSDAQVGAEIGVLLNPLETGFESGQVNLITMPVDTRINNGCFVSGEFGGKTFGEQTVSVSQRTRGSWSETDLKARFENKYIFSEEEVEGRGFFLFSKPFDFPFKIADLIYVTSAEDDYCFIGLGDDSGTKDIKDELVNLGQDNIHVEDIEDCPGESVNVCFSSQSEIDCDVDVDYTRGTVGKSLEEMHFVDDSLMYAAIFSEPSVYECQVKRLAKRGEILSSTYEEKSRILSSEDCDPNVDILRLKNAFIDVGSSGDFFDVLSVAGSVDSQNSRARCRLW